MSAGKKTGARGDRADRKLRSARTVSPGRARATEHEYVLGTHADEVTRLGFQHQVWRGPAYDLWDRAGFAPGMRLLDVGCGPGFTTRDLLALAGPAGSVVACDVSQRFVDHLEAVKAAEGLGNLTVLLRDVQNLDEPPGSLDGAYVRWVLSFVADPGKVVAGVARALRPGAIFALQEYVAYGAMRLSPPSHHLDTVVAAIRASWREQGGDSDVALRLPALLEAEGLSVREVKPVARVARPGTLLWQWPETFFVNFLPTLVKTGHLAEDVREAFMAEWRARSAEPTSFFVCPMVLDIVAVKG